MDRNYPIITKTDCFALAQGFLPYAQEAFLVTLANKGLYKRACKDLQNIASCELEAWEQTLIVTLPDAVVRLHSNPAESSCSCPSHTICKHILMAVLLAADYAQCAEYHTPQKELINSDADNESFLELKQVDLQMLQKQVGKKMFADALHLIHTGWGAKLIEGEMLEAALTSEPISVYFPKQYSIQHAICKCKEKGICKHKLIGILSYLSKQGSLSEDCFTDTAMPDASLPELLEGAVDYVVAVLEKGLVCCGEMDIEAAIQLSLRLETAGAQNLGRLLRSFAKDLQNMMSKHIAFQPEIAFATLSRIYHTAALVLKQPTNANLIESLLESGRSSYLMVPHGTFYGLGAYPWQTRSGFCGITAVLYYQEKQQICTCTVSLADYYEKTAAMAADFSVQFNMPNFWMQRISLGKISKSSFTLENFRINQQNRISSSQKTSCVLLEKTKSDIVDHLPKQKLEKRHYSYFLRKAPEQIIPFFVDQISETHFDRIRQKLSFVMKTEEEDYLVELPYTTYYEWAIRQIEWISMSRIGNTPFWVLCRVQDGQLRPLSILTGTGIWNLYFEALEKAGEES